MFKHTVSLAVLMVGMTLALPTPSHADEELRVPASGDVVLAGTLFLPEGSGPFPIVVFTHGSGPDKRSNRAYTMWTQQFRQHGIATLGFDKRGVGESTGEYVEAPDLTVPAGDLLAWVNLLTTHEKIARELIGVMGWSQGGWVGPLAASMSDDISFVVSISGPGVSPLEQNIYDKTNQFRATGASDDQVETFSKVIRLVWTYIVAGTGEEAAQTAWDSVKDEAWFADGYHGPPMMDRERLLQHPRMTHYVAHSIYDPVPTFESLRIPVLAVFGGADTSVPVDASIAAMRAAFARAGNRSFVYRVFPGADHGVHVATASGTREPADGFVEFVTDWVVKTVGGKN